MYCYGYSYNFFVDSLPENIQKTFIEKYELDASVKNVVVFETPILMKNREFKEYLSKNDIPEDCKIFVYKDVKLITR